MSFLGAFFVGGGVLALSVAGLTLAAGCADGLWDAPEGLPAAEFDVPGEVLQAVTPATTIRPATTGTRRANDPGPRPAPDGDVACGRCLASCVRLGAVLCGDVTISTCVSFSGR